MSKRNALKRHALVIGLLDKRAASYEEIENMLQLESEVDGDDLNISKRTLQRDIREIESIFGIEIKYDAAKRAYKIASEYKPEHSRRMLESYNLFNALQLSGRLSKHIHFENRKPQGTEFIHRLLKAIDKQVEVKFNYYKFYEDKTTARILRPYALKEFRNRWYLLGLDVEEKQIPVKTFALDRLSELQLTTVTFERPKDFDVNEQFKHCFGIISPDDQLPETVILSFDEKQGKYIKSLPLHPSQEILVENDSELRFKLKVFITHDFIMELLSYGHRIKVLEPQSLANDLKATYESALHSYYDSES